MGGKKFGVDANLKWISANGQNKLGRQMTEVELRWLPSGNKAYQATVACIKFHMLAPHLYTVEFCRFRPTHAVSDEHPTYVDVGGSDKKLVLYHSSPTGCRPASLTYPLSSPSSSFNFSFFPFFQLS